MTREIQSVLLLLVGGAMLRLSVGDVYLRYVKEGMRPWLLVSGGLLVLGGVLILVDVLRTARRASAAEADLAGVADESEVVDNEGHSHAHGGPRSAWMLLLPVAAIFLVAPPALGSFTAERQASSVIQPADSSVPPLPPGNPVVVSLADYAARAVWDNGTTLKGRNVKMVGFVTPNPAGGWWLTRLQLACCAADAVATKIVPVGGPASLPADTWVQVTGQWEAGGGVQNEKAIPWLKVDSLTEVAQPKNPYE
ncbi:MAG: TIGR03943 family protein [Actinobacteria bacterium]|uniref:Unannotated protein n=1 Tax=freshwater metagenome TaxID=449393 RepID=A0A6J7KYN5_9ZZZZ|nr:TIGR03943 family protein [Actinomycetota bacterium]